MLIPWNPGYNKTISISYYSAVNSFYSYSFFGILIQAAFYGIFDYFVSILPIMILGFVDSSSISVWGRLSNILKRLFLRGRDVESELIKVGDELAIIDSMLFILNRKLSFIYNLK